MRLTSLCLSVALGLFALPLQAQQGPTREEIRAVVDQLESRLAKLRAAHPDTFPVKDGFKREVRFLEDGTFDARVTYKEGVKFVPVIAEKNMNVPASGGKFVYDPNGIWLSFFITNSRQRVSSTGCKVVRLRGTTDVKIGYIYQAGKTDKKITDALKNLMIEMEKVSK